MTIFEWNARKEKKVKKEHKVTFDTALLALEDPFCCEVYDTKHSDSEDRYRNIGIVGNVLYTVIVTYKEKSVRIITAWKSTKKEKRLYYENKTK